MAVCWKCKSDRVRTFQDVFLKIKGFIFAKKTDIQLLYVCADCGAVKVLVHEYKSNYDRQNRHTGHYPGCHIHGYTETYMKAMKEYEEMRARHEEFCKSMGMSTMQRDGFGEYISNSSSHFLSLTKTPYDPTDCNIGKFISLEYSDAPDLIKYSEHPPLYDPRGDYVVDLPGMDDRKVRRNIRIITLSDGE